MFPNSYSFNPGMVLDPITMAPMITNGGSITVNPLGVPCNFKLLKTHKYLYHFNKDIFMRKTIFYISFMFSSSITKNMAKNVHSRYTLGMPK